LTQFGPNKWPTFARESNYLVYYQCIFTKYTQKDRKKLLTPIVHEKKSLIFLKKKIANFFIFLLFQSSMTFTLYLKLKKKKGNHVRNEIFLFYVLFPFTYEIN